MEEIEPVVRVGFVTVVLLTGALIEVTAGGFVAPEILCLPATGAFLTPSDTEARGRVAVAEDLTEVLEPVGETAGRVAVVSLDVVDAVGLDVDDEGGFEVEDKGGLEVEEDKDDLDSGGAEGLEGTIEVRRAGPVADVPVEGVFATEVGLVGLEAGALTDFLRADIAEEALLAADAATLDTALDAGAFFTAPAPNVPELRIYEQTFNEVTKIGPKDVPS